MELRASPGQLSLSDTLSPKNESSERYFLKTNLHAYSTKHNYKC